jgi:hypothetical protein
VVPPFAAAPPAGPARGDGSSPPQHSLVHAGGITGAGNQGKAHASYSMGMRQKLFARYGGEAGAAHGIALLNRSVGRAEAGLLRSSLFCLAPSGDGFGIRLSKAVLAGCLPLVAQPLTVQPLEDQLDYAAFSRRLELDELDEVPRLLREAAPRVREMRASLKTVRNAFHWAPVAAQPAAPPAAPPAAAPATERGDAYAYTLLTLCQRAVELRGALRAAGASCAPLARGLPGAAERRRWPGWFPTALRRATRAVQAERRAAFLRAGGELVSAQVVSR